jgi:hypothetical protein
MHEIGTNNCKIGHTICPKTRRSALQVGNPNTLTISSFVNVPNGLDAEKVTKTFFRQSHIRGEWFRISPKSAVEYCTNFSYIYYSVFNRYLDNATGVTARKD